MLDAKKIVNRSHEAFFPLNKGFAVFQPIVDVNEAMAITSSQKSSPNAYFPQDFVKGTLCIKEEKEEGSFLDKKGVLNYFNYQVLVLPRVTLAHLLSSRHCNTARQPEGHKEPKDNATS